MNKNQENMLAEFQRALTDLDALLDGLPEGALDWSEKEEWSIREVLHHLADDGNVYTFIIERALATPDCKVFFGEFPGNKAWAERLAFGERPVESTLNLIQAQRHFLAELVGCFPERWENKVNYYNTEGEKVADRTVAEMILMLTEHMQDHTEMIQNIIKIHT
ncbi:MAG: DinB family protein [Brevefilum sp.]